VKQVTHHQFLEERLRTVKRWVTALVVLTIVIATTAIVFALSGDSEPDRNVSEGPGIGPADGDGGGVDIIDGSECDPVPLRSDCDIDPDECNLIHNISACDDYDVTVRFNDSAVQEDIDEAGALLRTYDSDFDFIIMEIFPPIGRAVLETDVADFCRTVTSALEGKSYVESVKCAPMLPGDFTDVDPDAPVQQSND
jgi:hypothetical protein